MSPQGGSPSTPQQSTNPGTGTVRTGARRDRDLRNVEVASPQAAAVASRRGPLRRDRRPSRRTDRRPARGGDDPALRAAFLAGARARRRSGDLQPARYRPGDGSPGDAARRRCSFLRTRVHEGVCTRIRGASATPVVAVRLRGWCRRLSAGWLPRLVLRPARARMARALRARSSCGAPRGSRRPRCVMACPAPRGRGLPARARLAGDARHRLLRQSQRPAAAPARSGGYRFAHGGLSRRPRALAAPLPGRRPSLLRPEGEVRVRLPTTKEARCPSTSCSRR
jgi:hypothetical protein